MDDRLLSTQEAARLLGISAVTLYDWLGQSNRGLFFIRGQRVVVDYLQGGAKGHGRIKIPVSEVERLKELMRVRPEVAAPRRTALRRENYPGITVPLGRPPA